MPTPFSPSIALPKRIDGTSAKVLTITQSFHEWVHSLEDEGWNMADGSRGKPSFPADVDAVKAIRATMDSYADVIPYGTSPLGEKHYRVKAAEGFSHEYGVDFHADDMVFTPGGQFGLASTFYALEKHCPDGVILATQPWYLNHEELASMFSHEALLVGERRNKFVPIPLEPDSQFRLTAAQLEQTILACKNAGQNVSAVVFCNPANPIGVVLRKEEWQGIAAVLDKHPEIAVLLDEAFVEVVFDKRFDCSLLHAAPHFKERTFLFRSGTKALGLAGERLAVMAVPEKFHESVIAFQSRLIGNPPFAAQAGMAEAMATMSDAKKANISEYYAKNHALMAGIFADAGLAAHVVNEPEGGFFMLLALPQLVGQPLPVRAQEVLGKTTIENDVDISFALIFGYGQADKEGVAVIPASAFGFSWDEPVVRVSFSSVQEEVREIAERIVKAVAFAAKK